MSDPLALLLPDEVWLDILGSLRYMDLRRARRINKRFYQLVQDPKFDLALFRKSPVLTPESQIEYKLHPVLDTFGLCSRVTHDWALLDHWHRERLVNHEDSGRFGRLRFEQIPASNLYDFPVCDEFATAPATTHFQVFYHYHVIADLADDCGVTVGRVLRAYADFWAKPVEPYLEENFRRAHNLSDDARVSKGSALDIHFTHWRPLNYSYNNVKLEARMPWDRLNERLDRLGLEIRSMLASGDLRLSPTPQDSSTDSESEDSSTDSEAEEDSNEDE